MNLFGMLFGIAPNGKVEDLAIMKSYFKEGGSDAMSHLPYGSAMVETTELLASPSLYKSPGSVWYPSWSGVAYISPGIVS